MLLSVFRSLNTKFDANASQLCAKGPQTKKRSSLSSKFSAQVPYFGSVLFAFKHQLSMVHFGNTTVSNLKRDCFAWNYA